MRAPALRTWGTAFLSSSCFCRARLHLVTATTNFKAFITALSKKLMFRVLIRSLSKPSNFSSREKRYSIITKKKKIVQKIALITKHLLVMLSYITISFQLLGIYESVITTQFDLHVKSL